MRSFVRAKKRALAGLVFCFAQGASLVSAGSLARVPFFPLPDRAKVQAMDGENIINGVPTQITVFVSPDSLESTANWFRKSIPQPYTEDVRGGDVIFGKPDEKHFATVKLSQVRGGTQGVMAVADLEQGAKQVKVSHARIKEWLSDFGVVSKVLSFNESVTMGTQAQTLLLVNDQSLKGNVNAVRRLLERRGFAFERELSDASNKLSPEQGATTLLFRSPAREAVVVVSQQVGGQTQLLINVLVQMKRG